RGRSSPVATTAPVLPDRPLPTMRTLPQRATGQALPIGVGITGSPVNGARGVINRKGISMINELDGLPGGVIGFEASGKIAADDYRDVILRELEGVPNTGGARVLVVRRGF